MALVEFHVASQPVAVAADFDDMAAVEQPVEQRGRHDLVVQNLAPEVGTVEDVLVAPVDELEEENGATAGDAEVADFFDD